MDGNKFVVEDGTGNTNIEGSLAVEQLTTFKGSIDLSSPIDSSSEIIIEEGPTLQWWKQYHTD
jgi:hypothetical protein